MDTSILQSPQRRTRAVTKLVVKRQDAIPYKDIIDMIDEQKERHIEVILYDELDELDSDWSDYTFFCPDFRSKLYLDLTANMSQECGQHLIVGPAVLRHRLQTNQELMNLRTCRPLYCELMKSVTMKLAAEVPNKRDLVELVHFMGGSVRKDTIQKTNVLIAARVEVKGKSMTLVGVPTLREDWIIECWKFRDNPYFNVLDEKFLDRFRLGVFEGLSLFFHGFKPNDTEDMIKNLEKTGGVLAEKPENASHVVYNPTEDIDSLPHVPHQIHVTQEWFWVSLHRGCCALEDNFALPSRTLRKKLADDSMNSPLTRTGRSANSKSVTSMRDCSGEGPSLNATPDYIYSNDDVENMCKSPRQPSKRLRICMEMVETEGNYVSLLKLVLKFKIALEQEIAQNDFMKKSDVAMIFGKLEPILEVHEKILTRLTQMLNDANNMLCTGKKNDDKSFDFAHIWVEMKEEMKRVYPPYLNSYDTAKNLFDTLDRENPKFHTFCKAKESNPEFHRLKLNDLMVKPVQRLPSVALLLREMLKKSDSSRLRASTEEAAKGIDEVLKIANKTRERNDHLISHMSKFTDIENVPPTLVASNRIFIREMSVNPVASTDPRFQQFYRLKLFLFHDLMIVSKIRSEKTAVQRLARHASFASLHARARRPYKYIEQISLSMMRNAFQMRLPPDILKNIENPANGKKPEKIVLFCIIHRDDQGGDVETIFESNDEDAVREFLDELHMTILSSYGRFFLTTEPKPLEELASSTYDALMRHLRKFISQDKEKENRGGTVSERTPRNSDWSHNMNESMLAPPPSQSKMRRAFSNAQLTLASTLGFARFTSRNNLAQINENSSFMASPRVSCDPAALANMTSMGRPTCNSESEATPKRGLRSRLTSTTFLNRTLNRNTSMRRQTTGFSASEKEQLPRSRTSSHRVTDL